MNSSCFETVIQRRAVGGLSATLAVLAFVSISQTASLAAVPVGPLAATTVGQAGFGTIKGRLVWGGPTAPPRANAVDVGKANKDPGVCAANAPIPDNGMLVDPKNKGIKFGFAYLPRPAGMNPDAVKALVAKTPKVEIDQKNCEFLPHATAAHQDQSLLFKSTDPVNHNVHITPFANAPFNLILPPAGQVEKQLVAERRPIKLVCDIHPWMNGYIMVFDHPFFAVTGDDGSFEIQGVPAGQQNVVVWQSAVGYVTTGLAKGTPVEVVAGKTVDLGEVKLDPAKVKGPGG